MKTLLLILLQQKEDYSDAYYATHSTPNYGMLLAVIAGVVLLFFVLREVFCWYYKINEGIKELKQTNANLKTLIELQGGKAPEPDAPEKKE